MRKFQAQDTRFCPVMERFKMSTSSLEIRVVKAFDK